MIHVVFNSADKLVLEKAIALDNQLAGEIVEIKDDYAVGPISKIFDTEGYQNRRNWWQQVLEDSPYQDQLLIVDDKLTVHQIKQKLNGDIKETLWIWMGQNQHDVCGYYWLISQLYHFVGQVMVLYLNNLPFINDKGSIFYPNYLHEILPKEFLKAKKLVRPVTQSEFEIDADEWLKLSNQLKLVRILEGGKKIVNQESDFFDAMLCENISKDFQKLPKIIQNTLNKMKPKTGDAFLVWRIKQLVKFEIIQVQGNWEKGWKEIEIALK